MHFAKCFEIYNIIELKFQISKFGKNGQFEKFTKHCNENIFQQLVIVEHISSQIPENTTKYAYFCLKHVAS